MKQLSLEASKELLGVIESSLSINANVGPASKAARLSKAAAYVRMAIIELETTEEKKNG